MKRTRSYKSENQKTPLGNINAMRVEPEARRADLELEGNDNGIMEISTNRLSHIIASVIKEISKEAGGVANLSRSLVNDTMSDGKMARPNVVMDIEENRSQQRGDLEYKRQELSAALTVIKETMKLDAAEPFNRPVDPVALEIPDYFDVIKTPMDFGTICNNLENGLKYMNSADVFMDVQYIWHNCVIYNKPGDHILKLLKRVKTFFMKHWKAAGLRTEQSPAIIDVHPVTESSILRHEKRQKESPHVNNFTHLQEAEAGQPQQSSSQRQCYPEKGESNLGTPYSRNTRKKRQIQGLAKESALVNNFAHFQETEASQPQQSSSQQQSSPEKGKSNLDSRNIRKKRQNQGLAKESPLVDNFTHLQEIEAGQPQESSSQQQSSPEKDEPTPGSRNTRKKRQIQGLADHQKLLLTAGRIKISTNEQGQPVGPEAVKLTNFLGHTARDGNLAPLTCKGWSKMPEANKEKMWQKVLRTFDIEPGCRQWVLLSIGSKWRNFKAQLKVSHYDTHATDEERLADRDERVLPDQWSFLVSQWSSDEFQRLSARNKANRAKVRFVHTLGRKSFARLLEEEREKRPDGQEPSQAELFILTRTRKNGQPVNETTAAVISKICESPTPEDAYHRVMGVDRRGGVSPSELNATHETIIPGHAEALKMVEEKNVEVVEMKERLASVEETCSQMAAQISTMVSMMANMQKAFVGQNIPNGVPVGIPNQSEPASTSNCDVPAKPARGRKRRR